MIILPSDSSWRSRSCRSAPVSVQPRTLRSWSHSPDFQPLHPSFRRDHAIPICEHGRTTGQAQLDCSKDGRIPIPEPGTKCTMRCTSWSLRIPRKNARTALRVARRRRTQVCLATCRSFVHWPLPTTRTEKQVSHMSIPVFQPFFLAPPSFNH